MNTAHVSENDLHAYLDGELPTARRAEIEAYLNEHAPDAQRLQAYRTAEEALRARFDPVMDEPVPPRLADRRAPSRHVWRYAAAVGWFVLGGLGGWYIHGAKFVDDGPQTAAWARRAVVAHVVYAPEVRHPVEVGADQEEHLVGWLSKRLNTPMKIPHLNNIGYSLVGGRLLPGEVAPVAQFMYQDERGQRLTLYVRTNMESSGETAFRFAQEGNVRVFYWVDRRLGYALSGEIPKEELLRVANAVYQHLNP